MNKHYPEFKKYTPDEINGVWEHGVIVLDTNILLNLYRYSEATRDEILSVMEKLKDRLWMPYQVGLEYFNNRVNTFSSIADMHNDFKKKLSESKANLLNVFNKPETSRHPHINREGLGKVYDEAIKQVTEYIDKQTEKLHNYAHEDIVLKKLLAIYDGKVGEDFSSEDLFDIYEEGEIRYAGLLPPGFMDEKEKRGQGLRHLFGDLIVWKEILNYSKSNGVDVIFVTEDTKDDWWHKKDGKLTPHRELIREFRKETGGHKILMYQQKGFIEASKQNVNETTTTEIEEVSKEDERISRERTEQILQGLRQSWTSQIPTVSAYPNYMKMLNNPLLAILEEQNRKMEAIKNSLPINALDLATLQGASPAVARAKAAVEAFGPASKIIKKLTQDK